MLSPSSQPRPPIVVVLGHVDHGKTSLLDVIRKTSVASKESGGITQHIGAYQAQAGGKLVTFLDTPGHEAFTAIRSRGAKVADIAILVVAADESVKPQTKEAARIIIEAGIPMIVAANKMDKPGANPAKLKQDLATENVLVEEWGGKIPFIEISALKETGISDLLEMVLLMAEMEELKDDRESPAEGVIIESNLDKRRGYVATALVRKGTLRLSDWIVVGTNIGKIKSMNDFKGDPVFEAIPSQPVEITGWSEAPDIGREFISSESKNEASEIASGNVSLAPLFSFLKEVSETANPDSKLLNLVVKSDVWSSLEAIENSMAAIKSDEVRCRVAAYDIGNIGEADIKTAIATGAKVIGFRVGIDATAKKLAERDSIDVKTFDIIYELIEYVRSSMENLLSPTVQRNVLGKLKVLAIFKKDGRSQVVGGRVMSGKIERGAWVEVMRGESLYLRAKLAQLQQNKEEASEVKDGAECGLRLDAIQGYDFGEIQEGDILEVFKEEDVKTTL